MSDQLFRQFLSAAQRDGVTHLSVHGLDKDRVLPMLHLNLNAEYFDAIAAGEKCEEFRLATPYWRRRLEGREYRGIVLKKGYPRRGDVSCTLARPWTGCAIKTITHPHFGPTPVQVFAITVN